MSKQEKLREVVRMFIKTATGFKPDQCPIDCLTDDLITDLHSQGVVIKVGGDEPYIPTRLNKEITSAVIDYKKKMIRAGYVAVEPIIREGG